MPSFTFFWFRFFKLSFFGMDTEDFLSVKTDFDGAEGLHDKIEKGEITGRAGILI